MKIALTLLVKSVLIALGLMAAASATDAAILKNIFGSGMTTMVILNEEIEDVRKIVKSFEQSGLLINASVKQLKKKNH